MAFTLRSLDFKLFLCDIPPDLTFKFGVICVRKNCVCNLELPSFIR